MNLFRCSKTKTLIKNVKIFNSIDNKGQTSFECGFKPNVVAGMYSPTSAGMFIFIYIENILNYSVHRHTGYVEDNSAINIDNTGFSLKRGIGGDNGSPAKIIAFQLEK